MLYLISEKECCPEEIILIIPSLILRKKEEVFDKETENTMDVSKLLGLKCEDTTDERRFEDTNASGPNVTDHTHSDEDLDLDNSYLKHDHGEESEHRHRIRHGGKVSNDEEREGFSCPVQWMQIM